MTSKNKTKEELTSKLQELLLEIDFLKILAERRAEELIIANGPTWSFKTGDNSN
ncbi:hypothetical protein [uncultured Sunxiuqinia sp.]|uniref:hypothetical protein n=1 Tax=uncultured Sunxiuqinia sp. TaxID=1573825 RepID=UPI002AA747A7|nr:hypothetical protein [uncultured Sunxiuqinia sp.]